MKTRAAPVVLALLLLTGCGGDGPTAAGEGSAEPGDETSVETDAAPAPSSPDRDRDGEAGDEDPAAAAVPEALDFSATQVSGAAFDARELAGTDTVFWFWAPWCTECAAAAPDVQAAAEAVSDARFVGVAGLSSDVSGMQDFVDTHGLTFPQLSDADGSIYTRFGITQQDTYVLVSADGDVETVPAYGGDIDLEQLAADSFG